MSITVKQAKTDVHKSSFWGSIAFTSLHLACKKGFDKFLRNRTVLELEIIVSVTHRQPSGGIHTALSQLLFGPPGI